GIVCTACGGRGIAATARDSVVLVFQQLGVVVRTQQLIELLGVLDLHREQPAFAVGVLVDRFRLVRERAVHGGDGAADGCVDVGGGLHRFDDGAGIADFDAVAD